MSTAILPGNMKQEQTQRVKENSKYWREISALMEREVREVSISLNAPKS